MIVVDDDQLVRTGIRLLLRGSLEVTVVADLSGRTGLLPALAEYDPDVLLMDVVMPEESGLSLARRVRMLHPALRIVLMSSIGDAALHADARNVGVDTFIPKTAPAADLIAALVGEERSAPIDRAVLSDRELQVVELVAAGASNEEISLTLHLSPNTVKTYVSRAMDKTGTSNRVQLALWMQAATGDRLVEDP
ncbi:MULTISPECIES: response regulator transcription factor [Microbacterium]|uniref:response regulator transcription factor n=1 Tax=Microbacterium TaxID=33882 RepID=UPI0027D81569|nr:MULTISPECIES: response regulator transcription factor [Microbacterium]